jgi:hypothetical protein
MPSDMFKAVKDDKVFRLTKPIYVGNVFYEDGRLAFPELQRELK